MAVPALPTKIGSGASGVPARGMAPPCPSTRMVRLAGSAGSGSTSTAKPSWRRASTITWVSSLHSAPRKRVAPRRSAASTSARLVRLFEPGTTTSARTGAASGTTSSRAGSGMGRRRIAAGGESRS